MADSARRRSALEGVLQPGRFGAPGTPGVVITERRDMALVHVECRGEADSAALGFTLPEPGHALECGPNRILWLGPGRWLITAVGGAYGALARSITEEAPLAAVNDVSSSRSVLRLSGPNVRDVLAAGCPLDLDAKVFTPGLAATSIIDHYTATLDCVGSHTIDIYVSRGYAVSFLEWLMEAAEEFAVELAPPLTADS